MAGEISVGENSWENSARGKHWFGKKWLGEFQQGETSGEIMAGRFQPSALGKTILSKDDQGLKHILS